MKDLLLQNKKLMEVQEEKMKILAAIWASLLVIAEEVALLWAAGVPKQDAAIITGATISSPREPGTLGSYSPSVGAPTPLSHQITPDFLHLCLFQPTAS